MIRPKTSKVNYKTAHAREHMRSFGKVWGLCVGNFGERSQNFEKLIDYIAEKQASHIWLLSGYKSSAEAKGVIKYRLQTEVAVESMRAKKNIRK